MNEIKLDPVKYVDLLDYFTQYAHDDWVMMDMVYGYLPTIFTVESGEAREKLQLCDYIDEGELLLKDLFSRGVMIGELVEGSPGFQPWDGDQVSWLTRIREWITAHNRLPQAAELGWLHVPGESVGP